MVQRNILNKKQKKVIKLLCEGYSIPTVASNIGMSLSGTYTMVANLCRRGYIVKNSATASPAMYYKPIKDEKSTIPQTEKKSESLPPDYANPTIPPTICRDGVYFTNPPEKSIRWHMADGIHFKVRAVGSFDDITFCGRKIGGWDNVRDFKTQPDKIDRKRELIYHKGYINAFGQHMKILYYNGVNCGNQFTLFPGSIFTVPGRYDKSDMSLMFSDRALWIAGVLRNTNWQITEPTFSKKNVHWATRDPDLLQHYKHSGHVTDDDDLIVDTSDGIDEVEAEHWGNDPLGDEKAILMAKLPERILTAESDIKGLKSELSKLERLDEMGTVLDKVLVILDKMESTNVKIVEILTTQEQASATQSRINANLIYNIAAGNQTTIENFNRKKTEDEKKPSDEDYMGAYQ